MSFDSWCLVPIHSSKAIWNSEEDYNIAQGRKQNLSDSIVHLGLNKL